MNSITLRFKNKELAAKYEEYYIQEQTQIILGQLKQLIIVCCLCMIAFYVEHLYYSCCLCLISGCGTMSYCLLFKRVPAKLTIAFSNCYHFVAIIIYWTAFNLDSERSLKFIVHYNLFTIFLGFTFVFTENIILAGCQMFFYVASCIFVINYYIQNSILQMMWIPIIIIWFLQYHTKIKRKRQLFQQSQVNESIYELIKQTTTDDFFLFSFDEGQTNYSLKLTNKADFQVNEFLRKFHIGNINLSTFLYREFVQNKNNTTSNQEINGFYSNGKTPQKYYLYVQTYPKLMFYMRFIPLTYKPKEMCIYHFHIINNFFRSIDKLRKRGSVESIIQMINKVKIKFYLQTVSATLHLHAYEYQLICLPKLLKSICVDQSLEAQICGRSHTKVNYQLIQIYSSALVSIIKRFNQRVLIDISSNKLSTQINFKFDIALNVEGILQTQYFKCLRKIDTIISLSPIQILPNLILIALITDQEFPFTDSLTQAI